MRFTPGPLSWSDAQALNRLWAFMENVLRMRGSPPVETNWYAGVPTIGLDQNFSEPAWVTITGNRTNGTYPANVSTLDANTLTWSNATTLVQVLGGNNETLTVGTRYLGCEAGQANAAVGNVGNCTLYAVTAGGTGNVNIAGSGLLGNVNLQGNLGNAGRVANLTLASNGVVSAGAGSFNYSFDTANYSFANNTRLALLTVGSSNVALTTQPANGDVAGFVGNTAQVFYGSKRFSDSVNITTDTPSLTRACLSIGNGCLIVGDIIGGNTANVAASIRIETVSINGNVAGKGAIYSGYTQAANTPTYSTYGMAIANDLTTGSLGGIATKLGWVAGQSVPAGGQDRIIMAVPGPANNTGNSGLWVETPGNAMSRGNTGTNAIGDVYVHGWLITMANTAQALSALGLANIAGNLAAIQAQIDAINDQFAAAANGNFDPNTVTDIAVANGLITAWS